MRFGQGGMVPRGRALRTAAAAAAAVAFAGLPLLAREPAGARAAVSQPSPLPTPLPTGGTPFARGRGLYNVACAGCHGQAGEGSRLGPDLRGAGAADADYQLSSGRMPLSRPQDEPQRRPPAFTRADIDALVTYVSSFGAGPPIPPVRPGDPRQGGTLYLRNCASCHSSSAVGATLPGGRYAPSLREVHPVQIAEAVRLGPGTMPPFSRRSLSDAELDSVISYLTTLRRADARGGARLGGVGPTAEGVVGWVAGVGVLLVVVRLLGKRAS
ncbi:cytochrome bc1 complex diheme cytochrome c subunit [Sphaerisporangium fuscum]|uniref:cytochrome bc1 complex diheme cytochrome c subunit n=1 Tax=Sphaerisporangium fuscum TaxID=2835868 RepID=UPI001BDD1B29|nr:c-type cytochrome [Sphaerisporangium fuscum]